MPEINSMDSIFKEAARGRARSRRSPATDVGVKQLGTPAKSGLGVMAKVLAGAVVGREEMKQQVQMQATLDALRDKDFQRRMRANEILSQHEERGMPEAFTRQVLLKEYASTGDEFYRKLASEFKVGPKSRDQNDPVKIREQYVKARYGGAENAIGVDDPTLRQLDAQIRAKFGSTSLTEEELSTQNRINNLNPDGSPIEQEKEGKGFFGGMKDLFTTAKNSLANLSSPVTAASPDEPITEKNKIATIVKAQKGKPKEKVKTLLSNQLKSKRITQEEAAQIWDELYG